MKKTNIKMQLTSMNNAIVEFSEKKAKKEGLKQKDVNTIRQNVLYSQPYNNMEVYRTNKIYKTLKNRAEAITNDIEELKSSDEEE